MAQADWAVGSNHSRVPLLWPGNLEVDTLSRTTSEGRHLGRLLEGRLDLECQVKEVGVGSH